MSKGWNRPYDVVLRCLRGLEHNLFKELQSFGIARNSLVKSNTKVSVLGCNLPQLYFLSYFPRLASRIYVDLGNIVLRANKGPFICPEDLNLSHFLSSDNTYHIECRHLEKNDKIRSRKYACQLVKDGINEHFKKTLGLKPPNIELNQPEIRLEVEVDAECNGRLLVDAVGEPLSRRGYRHKTKIPDIDATMACSILHDIGYSSFLGPRPSITDYERQCTDDSDVPETSESPGSETPEFPSQAPRSLVDLFSGCGVFLIEAALGAARIPPGHLRGHFAFQKFPVYDETAFERLRKYADTTRVTPSSQAWESLRGRFIGIERDWEKLEEALRAAETAGTLDLVTFLQADLLKDGLSDARRGSDATPWDYMVAQLPKMRLTPDKLSTERYATLLKSLSQVMSRYFRVGSKGALVLPSEVERKLVAESFGRKLSAGATFNKAGVTNTTYFTA